MGSEFEENAMFIIVFHTVSLLFLYYSEWKIIINVIHFKSQAVNNHSHASLSFSDTNPILHRLSVRPPEQWTKLQCLQLCQNNFATLRYDTMDNFEVSIAPSFVTLDQLFPLCFYILFSFSQPWQLCSFSPSLTTYAKVLGVHARQAFWDFSGFSLPHIAIM